MGDRYGALVGESAEVWREKVERSFGFLADYGFRSAEIDDTSPWETWVQYRTSHAAIRVVRSNEFVRAEVQLIRLVDGSVPPYPIWVTSAQINWALLDTVLEVRQPDRLREARALTGLDDASVERQLAFWAEVLRTVALDFLNGDLAAVDEAALLVRERVRQNPQAVTAWIPEDSPPGTEAKEIEELSQQVPAEVAVFARRYRRGRKPNR